MEKYIIKKRPFIFENGNTYYFDIIDRESSYHKLILYKKIKVLYIFNMYKKIDHELIDKDYTTEYIKSNLYKMTKKSLPGNEQLNDFDGFVGDIPEDMKRDLKLKKLLK